MPGAEIETTHPVRARGGLRIVRAYARALGQVGLEVRAAMEKCPASGYGGRHRRRLRVCWRLRESEERASGADWDEGDDEREDAVPRSLAGLVRAYSSTVDLMARRPEMWARSE